MIRKLAKDAVIAPLLKEFDLATEGETLRKRFQEDHKKELDRMWELFLEDVAIERATLEHPKLLTKLEDTPLSDRTKKLLMMMDVKDVKGIAIYSPQEMRMFRGMGNATVQVIVDYVKGVMQE